MIMNFVTLRLEQAEEDQCLAQRIKKLKDQNKSEISNNKINKISKNEKSSFRR